MLMFNFFVYKEMLFKVLLSKSFLFFFTIPCELFFILFHFFFVSFFPCFSMFHSHDELTSKKHCFEMFAIDDDFFECF